MCTNCGRVAAQRDGMCRDCRIRGWGLARRKYHWTPELVEEVRQAYCGNRRGIGAALKGLMQRTGWPAGVFCAEAARRGWARHLRRWSDVEDEFVSGHLGAWSSRRIARALKRTRLAVEARARELRLSVRVGEGYTLLDLQQAFGEGIHVVGRWQKRGLLGSAHRDGMGVRIPDANVVRFIREHAREYDLRRVDQVWFKSMLFGALAERGLR